MKRIILFATALAAASSIGTTLEWYDFTIYNTMAALIFNRVFFPSVDPFSGILLAFSTYAVGYLSRPLGGVVFGHLGDKLSFDVAVKNAVPVRYT